MFQIKTKARKKRKLQFFFASLKTLLEQLILKNSFNQIFAGRQRCSLNIFQSRKLQMRELARQTLVTLTAQLTHKRHKKREQIRKSSSTEGKVKILDDSNVEKHCVR